MSIPQICPSCGNHISAAHTTDCCYGTSEYAHIGWPSYQVGAVIPDIASVTDSHWGRLQDSAGAIRRLLEYLEGDEPEASEEPYSDPKETRSPNSDAILLLTKRSEELRKEAAGISLVESRAKRNFAADVLDAIIQELVD